MRLFRTLLATLMFLLATVSLLLGLKGLVFGKVDPGLAFTLLLFAGALGFPAALILPKLDDERSEFH